MKTDSRGKFWQKIPKNTRTEIMSSLAKKRWSKTTPEERIEYAKKLSSARWSK